MRTHTRRIRLALPALALAMLSGCHALSGHMNNQFGWMQYQQGNYTAARHDFRRAVADWPENPDYVYNLATAMRKQGDHAAAERTYRHALYVDPSHQPSYHGLALLLREQGRVAEAHDLVSGWANAQPYLPAPHIELAWLQRESGDFAGAEESLRTALQVQPNHPIALAHLGQVYQDSGQRELAVGMYQRSLYAHWNQPEVHSRMTALRDEAGAMPPAYAAAPEWAPTAAAPPFGQPFGPQPVVVHSPPAAYAAGPAGPMTFLPPVQARPGHDADPAHAAQFGPDLPVVRPY